VKSDIDLLAQHQITLDIRTFEPATVREIVRLRRTSPSKSCALVPIPTWLRWLPNRLSKNISPVICNLCNRSMQPGIFPSQLTQAHVLPLLKKSTTDPNRCSSCRPISNLSFISKLIDRVAVRLLSAVCIRVQPFSQFNSLLTDLIIHPIQLSF